METGWEKDLDQRSHIIDVFKMNVRHDLLEKAKNTVDTFLADMNHKIKQNSLYLHHNVLLRNTLDTQLEALIKTVHAMESEIATAYDVFENKCHPIMEGNIPIPAPIQKLSTEILHEYPCESDKYNKETITVFTYEEQIRRAVIHMLADQDPDSIDHTHYIFDSETQYDLDETEEGTEMDIIDSIDFRLDCKRDTIEEVTTIVNLYPEAMNDRLFPYVTFHVLPRSVPFIPSIISLWMKRCNRKVVEEDPRDGYGLVCYNLINPSLARRSYHKRFIQNYHATITLRKRS